MADKESKKSNFILKEIETTKVHLEKVNERALQTRPIPQALVDQKTTVVSTPQPKEENIKPATSNQGSNSNDNSNAGK